jgi:hypothetical protein
VPYVSTDCIDSINILSLLEEVSSDLRRTKRLLRRAIAASKGKHRIRLQRELAAVEDYERKFRQQTSSNIVSR